MKAIQKIPGSHVLSAHLLSTICGTCRRHRQASNAQAADRTTVSTKSRAAGDALVVTP